MTEAEIMAAIRSVTQCLLERNSLRSELKSISKKRDIGRILATVCLILGFLWGVIVGIVVDEEWYLYLLFIIIGGAAGCVCGGILTLLYKPFSCHYRKKALALLPELGKQEWIASQGCAEMLSWYCSHTRPAIPNKYNPDTQNLPRVTTLIKQWNYNKELIYESVCYRDYLEQERSRLAENQWILGALCVLIIAAAIAIWFMWLIAAIVLYFGLRYLGFGRSDRYYDDYRYSRLDADDEPSLLDSVLDAVYGKTDRKKTTMNEEIEMIRTQITDSRKRNGETLNLLTSHYYKEMNKLMANCLLESIS